MDFNTIYKENFDKVQMFCYRWTGNTDDASDASQEAFTELYQKIDGGEDIKKPLAWVYKVAYNRCINLHKYNERFTDGDNNTLKDQEVDALSSVQRERQRLVKKAILRLKDKEKALVILYKLGFSYMEMASIIEINPNSVGKTLTRAIDKLSKWTL